MVLSAATWSVPRAAMTSVVIDDAWVEPLPEPSDWRLSSLFDRLAEDDGLYTPLTVADEAFTGPAPTPPEMVFLPPQEPDVEPETELARLVLDLVERLVQQERECAGTLARVLGDEDRDLALRPSDPPLRGPQLRPAGGLERR